MAKLDDDDVKDQEEEMTRPISIRIGAKDYDDVEAIRDLLDERTGVKPARSDIMRKAMRMGISSYCEAQEIDLAQFKKSQKKRGRRSASA